MILLLCFSGKCCIFAEQNFVSTKFNIKNGIYMSVSVKIRTKDVPEPDAILRRVADKGTEIVATSNEYPSLKFGFLNRALRGIEVNEEEDGLEVRVCSFSTKADYQLFVKAIDVIMQLTGAKAYLEDEGEVIAPLSAFNDEWIEREQEAGFDAARALVKHTGLHIVMYGLFCKFCLGAHLFESFDIPLSDDVDKEDVDSLFDNLCSMQWDSVNWKDTSTRMVMPSSDGDVENGLTISAICIRNGQVDEFDYISEADLLGIIDMDDDAIPPVFIPFREIWKILPNDAFERLDEMQFRRTEALTVDMVHDMMDAARHLQPDDLHYKPTYPGEGFDEKQRTFILMWNPDISSVSLEDHCFGVEYNLTEYFNWSVWDYDKARCGDRFFLVRVGKGNTGIVMSGVFDSQPYEGEDWSGKGRSVYYMDMLPNVILDPEEVSMLTTEALQESMPSFDWTGGHSGRLLGNEDAIKLETLWQRFLAEHSKDADGITMSMIHTIR